MLSFGGGGNPKTPPFLAVAAGPQKIQIDKLEQDLASAKQQLSQRAEQLAPQQQQWEQQLLTKQGSNPWQVLLPESVKAVGQQLKVLDDGSVLAGGPNPANDTYTISVRTKPVRIAVSSTPSRPMASAVPPSPSGTRPHQLPVTLARESSRLFSQAKNTASGATMKPCE